MEQQNNPLSLIFWHDFFSSFGQLDQIAFLEENIPHAARWLIAPDQCVSK
jgi:hypothetical protein